MINTDKKGCFFCHCEGQSIVYGEPGRSMAISVEGSLKMKVERGKD